jgi:hypothetical protein
LEVIALDSIKPICLAETDFGMRSLWVHIDCLGTNVRDKFREYVEIKILCKVR